VAPVNRVPPEILALVPDFWSKDYDDRDRDVIALTHVCQAWREVFISRASLWTNLDYEDEDKTRAYFERSKSLPINLSLGVGSLPSSSRPLFKTIPHAIGRLRSLSIAVNGALEHLLKTTDHLSCTLLLFLRSCLYAATGIAGQAVTQCSHLRTLQWRSIFIARVEAGVCPHGPTLEKHGQSHVVHAVLHVVGRSLSQATSRLL
jgi:hypothetical protein